MMPPCQQSWSLRTDRGGLRPGVCPGHPLAVQANQAGDAASTSDAMAALETCRRIASPSSPEGDRVERLSSRLHSREDEIEIERLSMIRAGLASSSCSYPLLTSPPRGRCKSSVERFPSSGHFPQKPRWFEARPMLRS